MNSRYSIWESLTGYTLVSGTTRPSLDERLKRVFFADSVDEALEEYDRFLERERSNDRNSSIF